MSCTICLKDFSDSTASRLVTEDGAWIDLLGEVFPQLPLQLKTNQAICETCLQKLKKLKAFRDSCNVIENKIKEAQRRHAISNGATLVNLKHILYLMEGKNEEERIASCVCRTCLIYTSEKSFSLYDDSTHSIFLRNLFPEMDLELTSTPVICHSCASFTEEMYQFQQLCLHSQDTLQDISTINPTLCVKVEMIDQNSDSDKGEEKPEVKYLPPPPDNLVPETMTGSLGESTVKTEFIDVKDIKKENEEDPALTTNTEGDKKRKGKKRKLASESPKQDGEVKKRGRGRPPKDKSLDPPQEEEPTDCPYCDYRTRNKYYLKQHIKIKHNERDFYKCEHCQYKTKYRMELKRHNRVKHDENCEIYHCDRCDYIAKLEINLKKHIENKHENKQIYKCEMCSYQTQYKNSYTHHVKIRHDESTRSFLCEHCPYQTKYKQHLHEHIKVKHDESSEVFRCTVCEYSTRYKKEIQRHYLVEHDEESEVFQCPECHYNTKLEGNLKKHMRYKHDENSEWFKCEHCPYQTKYKNELKRHNKVKHDENGTTYNCDQCSYTTKHENNLRRHVANKHECQGQNFRCPHCPYVTKYRRTFKIHCEVQHDDTVKVFHCELCPYKTKYKQHLDTHFKSRHDETIEKFNCDKCEYVTKYKYNLGVHGKVVHEENSSLFDCEYCHYQTKNKYYLKRHFRSKHEDELCFYGGASLMFAALMEQSSGYIADSMNLERSTDLGKSAYIDNESLVRSKSNDSEDDNSSEGSCTNSSAENSSVTRAVNANETKCSQKSVSAENVDADNGDKLSHGENLVELSRDSESLKYSVGKPGRKAAIDGKSSSIAQYSSDDSTVDETSRTNSVGDD